MHTMGKKREMFVGLGWKQDIRSLGNPYVPFIPSPDYDRCAGNKFSDVHELIPFL